jgi:GNAT superfamily N-acetyltransferase
MKLEVAKILSEAFIEYPLILHAFEGLSDADRLVKLNALYGSCASACEKFGGVILDDKKQGALIWLDGKNFPLGLMKEIQTDMIILPFKLGIKSTLRLINHDSEIEGWIRKNTSRNIGYIWCLGVDKDLRGKGIARQLIMKSIDQMKEKGITEFWLKTEDSKNVLIYEKIGFKVMQHKIVKSSGIGSWAMKYETKTKQLFHKILDNDLNGQHLET